MITLKLPETVDGRPVAPEPVESARAVDYTQIPKELDAKFEKYDDEGTLRPTIINVSNEWRKRAQKALLGACCDNLCVCVIACVCVCG